MAISGTLGQRPAFCLSCYVGPLASHAKATLPTFPERQIDAQAARCLQRAGNPSQVELPYLTLLKRQRQAFLDVHGQGNQQHAAGAFVQTMYLVGSGTQKLGELLPEAGFAAPVGKQRHVRWFVDHREAGLSVQNGWHLGCPFNCGGFPGGRQSTIVETHGEGAAMRAAVMRNGTLVADDVPAPVPQSGEVLVKTLACGICGSDLHVLQHSRDVSRDAQAALGTPIDPRRDMVMGHEFCAEVLDYGPGTERRVPVGARVCSVPTVVRQRQVVGVGYSHDVPGGYAEQMVLMEPSLLPVPNGLSTDRAALTEPMAVGLHAVEMARLAGDEVTLVIGCGPVGLAVISALKLKGVRPIVAADFSPARRSLAETMGADIVIDPALQSPYGSWEDAARASAQGAQVPVNPLTGERLLPPGVFFECVGVPGVIDQMMVGAQPGCRFVIVGVCMEQDHIRPLLAIGKELNLQFVLAYTADEFARTLQHIAEGEIDVDPLITGRVGVSGVAQAFADLGNPEAHAKILVEPWHE